MSKKRYLQQLGQSWYLRIKVPTALRGKVGNTHIRRALHTRDLDEANRRKWPAIAQIRAYFDSLEGLAISPLSSIKLNVASTRAITQAQQSHTHSELRPTTGLDSLAEEWARTSSVKTVQYQRLQAYKELREYLREDRHPVAITDALAAEYVDERLLRSADSPSTRRRKLSALAAFWEWMASRRYLQKGFNPWRGFRLGSHKGTERPGKRPYTMNELVTLFSGNPTYPALREVMVLGLYTGARIDEICSLTRGDIRFSGKFVYIHVARSKTSAGIRTIAIRNSIPLSVLKNRFRETLPAKAQLFHELKGGGYDNKLSWRVGQAFRYHRDGRGLTRETDFHSLRRTFITRLENLGIDQVRIARYVGHSLPTLAFKLYSGGATEATQEATGRAMSYPAEVEAAVLKFVRQAY